MLNCRHLLVSAALLNTSSSLPLSSTVKNSRSIWSYFERTSSGISSRKRDGGLLRVCPKICRKRVNDTVGHAVGSHVLKEIARLLTANLRDTDVLCRYGGDEFILCLPGCGLERGLEAAERIRLLVKMSVFRLGSAEVSLTLSMGVEVSTRAAPLELDVLLARADAALYRAKALGRDRVCTPLIVNPPAVAGSGEGTPS